MSSMFAKSPEGEEIECRLGAYETRRSRFAFTSAVTVRPTRGERVVVFNARTDEVESLFSHGIERFRENFAQLIAEARDGNFGQRVRDRGDAENAFFLFGKFVEIRSKLGEPKASRARNDEVERRRRGLFAEVMARKQQRSQAKRCRAKSDVEEGMHRLSRNNGREGCRSSDWKHDAERRGRYRFCVDT